MSSLAELDPWRPTAKAWSTRCARAALHGRVAYRSDPDDAAQQRFFIVAGTEVTMLPDAVALDLYLDRLDSRQAAAN